MLDKLLRYGHVEQLLGPEPIGTILEVGAGPQGLGSCLPYRFTGVDPWYPESPVPSQTAVRASGVSLPFSDRAFDNVLCIEVLEHVPPHLRLQAVRELCRVAGRQVIITHPYGKWARIADRILKWKYTLLKPLGITIPWWIAEHFEHPFPEPDAYLPFAADFSIELRGQESVILHPLSVFIGNLKPVARWISRWYERNPAAFKRVIRGFDFPPFYRIVIVMKRRDANGLHNPKGATSCE